jgi:hypothetical protein
MSAWQEAKAYAAAQHGIYKRRSALITEPQSLANSLAIRERFRGLTISTDKETSAVNTFTI